MKKGSIYKVLSAEETEVCHYHGTLFDYAWNLMVESEDGKQIEGRYETWIAYDNLVGETIMYDGLAFKVVEA